jgi:hypothetical protein
LSADNSIISPLFSAELSNLFQRCKPAFLAKSLQTASIQDFFLKM